MKWSLPGIFSRFAKPAASPAASPAATVGRRLVEIHAPRGNGTVSAGYQGPFEALNDSPNRSHIPTVSLGLETIFGWSSHSETANRLKLASLGRYILDNYPGAAYAAHLISEYSGPILPRGATEDIELNGEYEDYFDDWAERSDFYGVSDFRDIQRMSDVAMITDGDVLFTMDDSHGWPQLRAWPSWRVGTGIMIGKANQNPDGVIFAPDGSVAGYQLVLSKDSLTNVSVNASILIHRRERFERFRGMTPMRQGFNDSRDSHDFKAMVKLGAKVKSSISAVIQGHSPLPEDWEDPDNPGKPFTNGPRPKGITSAQLFGGDIPVIDGEIKQFQTQPVSAEEVQLIDALAGYAVTSLGMPAAFFNDEKLTGPNTRAVISKAQRCFDSFKREKRRLAKWCWVRVIGHGIATGQIPENPLWTRCRYQGPPLFSIDVGDQAKADLDAFKAGLRTRQKLHANAGDDWQDEVEQAVAEDVFVLNKCKEVAATTGVPLEVVLARHGYVAPAKQEQGPDKPTQ